MSRYLVGRCIDNVRAVIGRVCPILPYLLTIFMIRLIAHKVPE